MPDSGGQLEIAAWLWDRRNEIRQTLTDVFQWFRSNSKSDSRGILVIGPGGTGKTTLAKLLSGEFDFLFDAAEGYQESIGVERYSFTDAPEIEIVVPPGQVLRRESTWTDLQTDLAAGKFRGVVLVAAYGYHTIGQFSYKQHRLYDGSKERFLDAYLAAERANELGVLRQIAPFLQANPKRQWLLTVVSKQDLWWPQKAEVEKHYLEGEFDNELQRLRSRLDSRNLRCETVFTSLAINNFTTGMKEHLKANTAGYDQQRQVETLRRLFEVIKSLKDWEEGQ